MSREGEIFGVGMMEALAESDPEHVGEFFHKGLKMTDEDAARIGRVLDGGHATVGVLSWDSETKAVADKLEDLGGTPQTHEVVELTAEAQ